MWDVRLTIASIQADLGLQQPSDNLRQVVAEAVAKEAVVVRAEALAAEGSVAADLDSEAEALVVEKVGAMEISKNMPNRRET
jgi:hypothetical protein